VPLCFHLFWYFLPLSGAAGLIYEIVWLQMLELVIGSTACRLRCCWATFMGGLCLGSLLLPRWISARHHPLRVYAYLELATGVADFWHLVRVAADSEHLYVGDYHGDAEFPAAWVACAICLLPPTLMMGRDAAGCGAVGGVATLGIFLRREYVGGVIGCFAAGFYLCGFSIWRWPAISRRD